MTEVVGKEELADQPRQVDLNGEFRFKVDAKGRVALPAKFRKVLSKDLVVTLELGDECAYVFETPTSTNGSTSSSSTNSVSSRSLIAFT